MPQAGTVSASAHRNPASAFVSHCYSTERKIRGCWPPSDLGLSAILRRAEASRAWIGFRRRGGMRRKLWRDRRPCNAALEPALGTGPACVAGEQARRRTGLGCCGGSARETRGPRSSAALLRSGWLGGYAPDSTPRGRGRRRADRPRPGSPSASAMGGTPGCSVSRRKRRTKACQYWRRQCAL